MCRTYERSELAEALASYLKGAKLGSQPVAGVGKRILTGWKKGEIARRSGSGSAVPVISRRGLYDC